MPRTRIVDRGFEAVINVIPRIGNSQICEIFDLVHSRLDCGNRVCVADIQEMFGLKRTKKTEQYILDDKFDTDWFWIWEENEPVGVSIVISGVYKERKKKWDIGVKKSLNLSVFPSETGRNGKYEQQVMQL